MVLTGDGGDELFAGYLRFRAALAAERLPRGAGAALAAALRVLPRPRNERHLLARARRFARFAHVPLVERARALEQPVSGRSCRSPAARHRCPHRRRRSTGAHHGGARGVCRRLAARSAARGQLRVVSPRRSAREDRSVHDGALARSAIAAARHRARRVRGVAARRVQADAVADEGDFSRGVRRSDPARHRPPPEDRLRRAARPMVPRPSCATTSAICCCRARRRSRRTSAPAPSSALSTITCRTASMPVSGSGRWSASSGGFA